MAMTTNFVVVITDDQGPWATSENWPELRTPNLDVLSAQSAVFHNYYCASPVCSPARGSLLTGRMPSAHGIHDWLVGGRHPDDFEENFLKQMITFPEVLNNNGYSCGMVGKWHVGTAKTPAAGFDYWYAHRYGGGPYYNAPIWDEKGAEAAEPKYFTDAVADRACEFLNTRDKAKPFFLLVNFTAPHSPWIDNHPKELLDLYQDTDFSSIPREEPHPWTKTYNDFADAFADPIPSLRGYAAALTGVDCAVGKINTALAAQNLTQNTVFIYMSDNGFSCGQHGLWGKGNGTYPLNFWENSVRVPFMVHLPEQTVRRNIFDHVSACSFYETICELAGVQAPEDVLRAAGSVADLIRGEKRKNNNPVMVFDEYGGGRMIRFGSYKFVDRYDGPKELYNLNIDPGERNNLADNPEYESIQSELADKLAQWFAAHETKVNRAYHRNIRGRGQIHPPSSGYADGRIYAAAEELLDGDDSH
ncbi:sulfatase-like hydrolase/transferase [Arcanobacterium hippocoleae]